jgi:DNA-binding GntR family transcriptional regulator
VLSKRLGVSPIPVIEALHLLEQDGLVESEPMFGHRVRSVDVERVRGDHIMREAIECQAARLCALKASDEQLALLSRQAEHLDKALKSEQDASANSGEHLAFHLGIARVEGGDVLAKALEKLWFRRLMVITTINAATRGVPPNWHGQLVKALATRDPDIAEKAMRQHVQFNVAEQLKLLENGKPESVFVEQDVPKLPKGRNSGASRRSSAGRS